jgi:quercetin dioxygenase-like cupin family protein
MMFAMNRDVTPTPCGDGVCRKILGMGGSLMMVEVTFRKGGVGDVHAHPHEQVSYIAKGSFEFTLNGETKVVSVGDSIYIPSNAPHGTVALEDSVIVDVFSPIREDFLGK